MLAKNLHVSTCAERRMAWTCSVRGCSARCCGKNHDRERGPAEQPCCVQPRAGLWWVKWEHIGRAVLSRSSWYPGSGCQILLAPSPRRQFHSSQQHPRAPTGPSSCVHVYVRRDVVVQIEMLVKKVGRSVKQTQDNNGFILTSNTWSLSEGRCVFRYIFTFSKTLWQ